MKSYKPDAIPPMKIAVLALGMLGLSASGGTGGRFDRCWRVQPSLLGADLKQLDVTVTWRDFQAGEVTLSALLFAGS